MVSTRGAAEPLIRWPAEYVVEQSPPIWFGAAFPVLFVGMWILVCTVLGRTGGWMRLADAYASFGTEVRGSRFRFRSGSFGCVNYNSVPMLEAGPQGLAFAVLLPFRISHRPFSVPWDDIRFSNRRRWLISMVELSFARCPGVSVTISHRLAQSLAAAGGVSHRLASAG